MPEDTADLVIREALPEDMPAIAHISRMTWDGHDYLEDAATEWMKSSGFVVALLSGRLIATARMSPMPGRILWLEGLRVHEDFQGLGYGKIISKHLVDHGRSRIIRGEVDAMEFSTYFDNKSSISISTGQGFRRIDCFYILYRDSEPGSGTAIKSYIPDIIDFAAYGEHIPCGWKLPHRIPESLDWLGKRCSFYSTERGASFYESGGSYFSPLTSGVNAPESFLDGIDRVLSQENESNECELIIHESHSELLSAAKGRGYLFWDETVGPNMYIFRLDQEPSG